MKALRSIIEFLGVTVPALLLAALVVIVLSDVIARNFFATSIMWAQELAVVLMAATVWLGLVGASMNGQLFGISLFVDRLPERYAPFARLLANILVLLICAQVIRAAFAQIATARFTTFLTLGWPKWIVAAFLATGMILVMAGLLLSMAEDFRKERP